MPMMWSMSPSYTGMRVKELSSTVFTISSTGSFTSTATMSTRGTRISCTVMSSNSMADWMISVSWLSSTPSSSTVSMMVFSSSSVTLGCSSSPAERRPVSSCLSLTKNHTTGENSVRRNAMTPATCKAKASGLSLAKLLGRISPKISTSSVMPKVAMAGPLVGPHRAVAATVASEALAMFTMLLPIRMVEMVLSKSSATFRAVFARLLPSSALLRMRILLKEEMAVSLAEKNAEQATRRTIAM